MSALRAKCPDCRTLTAVAIGTSRRLDGGSQVAESPALPAPERVQYQCHSCGREFAAGLVRVPRAWGDGGEGMIAAAEMEAPWPEAAVIAEPTLAAQIETFARELPARPVVLGGCCCSHVGAVRELARRHGRVGIVWLDAHGDLHVPETSPSGNAWGMPLRMLIDAGDVDARDVTLLGARNMESEEMEFIAESGVSQALGELPEQVYVAFDADVAEPSELDVWMPEPAGPRLADLEAILASLPRPIGAGFTGFLPSERNEAALVRLGAALGL